ncbi:hypothetical protein RF11_12533 [Thelohanellus kitauei]|uniref:Uncharacterized protein n=1 Tax=Thelohanellus kitauei TaxID=669202 RepID=A0A0C2IWM4_THEKT|nr:hypothetical protein RF11_12533 [Thelohanellus kitauei]
MGKPKLMDCPTKNFSVTGAPMLVLTRFNINTSLCGVKDMANLEFVVSNSVKIVSESYCRRNTKFEYFRKMYPDLSKISKFVKNELGRLKGVELKIKFFHNYNSVFYKPRTVPFRRWNQQEFGYIHNSMMLLHPSFLFANLKMLTANNSEWVSIIPMKIIQYLETMFASDNVLAHFDPNLPVVIAYDASNIHFECFKDVKLITEKVCSNLQGSVIDHARNVGSRLPYYGPDPKFDSVESSNDSDIVCSINTPGLQISPSKREIFQLETATIQF